MKLPIHGCGIALAVLVLAAPARAYQQFAEADVTDLTMKVQDLNPGDGKDPWIVLYGPPDMVDDSAYVHLQGPGIVGGAYEEGFGGGDFAPLNAHATLAGVGSGSATVSGDILGSGLNLHASSTLTMPANGTSSTLTWLDGGPLQLFTLSPWSTMVVSGAVTVSESGDTPGRIGGAVVALYTVSLPGDPDQSESFVASVDPGQSLVQTATLTFKNDSDQMRQGFFWGFTDTYLASPPVPEPSTVAMLLAGLGWMGLALRRQVRGTRSATA